jgi:hypothetical protein
MKIHREFLQSLSRFWTCIDQHEVLNSYEDDTAFSIRTRLLFWIENLLYGKSISDNSDKYPRPNSRPCLRKVGIKFSV